MIKTLKVTFTISKPKYFFCFCYVRGEPLLWLARSAEAPVRHARAEADKRALEPLPQSVDRAGWASQHACPPARGRRLGREAEEAEPLAAVDKGAEPEPEPEPKPEPVPLPSLWSLRGDTSNPLVATPTVTRTLVTKAHLTTSSPRLCVIVSVIKLL